MLLSYKTRQMDKTQVVTYEVFSGTYINISNDNILQIQIIWITTTAKIEDDITGQKPFYWLEYKSQFCIIFIFKHKYGNVYTRSLSSDGYSIYKFSGQIF
jgi:hypothetical protein